MKTAEEISHLAQVACLLEVCAPKPGNVDRGHDFTDTFFEDFLHSAVSIGPAFIHAGRGCVGQVILDSITNTRRRIATNTNLGIILLLAPLAEASLYASEMGNVRKSLCDVLNRLTVEDARLAYQAIRMAHPGGLGRVQVSDISEEPSITLLQAMTLAESRDSIAREYATGFEITFDIGFPALREALQRGARFTDSIVHSYMTVLSRVPDTLIARKTNVKSAQEVSGRAADVLAAGGIFREQGRAALEAFDRDLRDPEHLLNPGATADLTTAAIFLALLDPDLPVPRR